LGILNTSGPEAEHLFEEETRMKHLTFASFLLLAAGATVWALNDPNQPPTPTPRGVGQPAQPPGGGQPPQGFGGGAPGGFPGQPPMGFAGGGPGFQPPGFPPGGQANYKEMIPTLLGALADEDADVRRNVAHALAHIGRPAVEPLLAILKDKDKSKAARANAAYLLGKIGPQASEALPELTRALKGNDRELRRRAAFAIAHIVGGSPYQTGFQLGMPGGMGLGGSRPQHGESIADPGLLLPGKTGEKRGEPKGKGEKPEQPPPPPKRGL
jgi:hypothetical protein